MKKDSPSGNLGGEDSKLSKMGKKRSKNGGEEEESPVRTRVRDFVEGKFVTLLMSVTTIFALFGDDIRLWFTPQPADPYFYGGLSISFLLFTLEILINSCVIDDFKYSFFFWLDLIATLSLIPDIGWIMEFIQILLGFS